MPAPNLRLVLVTPETTLVDEPVDALRLPLYDGQIGIRPGRAPLVGRLGYGELIVTPTSGGNRSYYIDGGFIQVKGPVVSVLTNRAIPAEKLDREEASTLLNEASSRRPTTETEFASREKDQERGRKMLALAQRG